MIGLIDGTLLGIAWALDGITFRLAICVRALERSCRHGHRLPSVPQPTRVERAKKEAGVVVRFRIDSQVTKLAGISGENK